MIFCNYFVYTFCLLQRVSALKCIDLYLCENYSICSSMYIREYIYSYLQNNTMYNIYTIYTSSIIIVMHRVCLKARYLN